jgi:diguanylate cyclase (GGDEF)-like protein
LHSIRFGLLIVGVCGLFALSSGAQLWVWDREVRTLDARVEVIGNQIVALRNVMDDLLELETGQRGYVLTGEDAYLQPYSRSLAALPSAVAWLASAAHDDPAIRPRIAELAALVRTRIDLAARPVALRKAGDVARAIDVVRAGQGKQTMDAFRAKAEVLLNRLNRQRDEAFQRESGLFREASLLGAAVVLLILVLVSAALGWLSASVRHLDELQRRREREAMHDPLTALPNRRYLADWLGIALATARRTGQRLTLLYFDLDGFKAVNDRFGHDAGDRVLQQTAARLRAALRSSDFVARLGGDEFVAVLPNAPGEPGFSEMLARLRADLMRAPIPELRDGHISASVGVASYPEDGDHAVALLAAADQAMYAAKQARGSGAGRAA